MELEERRTEVLSRIVERRFDVDRMVQRPRSADDTLDNALLEKMWQQLTELERAKQAANTDVLDDLADEADLQETFSAYLCPREEIRIEGHLVFELMEWWGVPKSETNRLRGLLVEQLEGADGNPDVARRALHFLFKERDDWDVYREDYENVMRRYALRLFLAIMILPLMAVAAFHFAFRFTPLLIFGLLFAGVAGSCVSVVSKLPTLEVSPSEKLYSYVRQIWSRISVGTIASLIGCGLLGWGLIPISVQGHTFTEVLDACSTPCSTAPLLSCTVLRMLLLLAVPMLFGFSERALTSFEEHVFGKAG